ncbi:ATP-binding protein [Sandarakinorhabdus cyanobacteriorum]|uniref:ATP-binding protein n=1 Tax=Sandarakinorhabdus cyanobacteriorum TaxID=1981098 RepID=A0A255Y765_9SPHN|nr:ABC transporter ATP-binding protein [Sandarakinorhabdus cyanobacteriorum]OYQ25072.1 ATP-binding protein [Sandarakinorhabdus cyanobacteriorum]
MIRLSGVSKSYGTASGPVRVLQGVDFQVNRGESVGILGRNGAGKSTLIRIISGAETPDAGTIDRRMSVSWPLAFTGAFQTSLTGIDNLRFICRVYGVDTERHIPYVEEFSELGVYLREPVRSYSSGMQARLAFALSMVIEFDCFLIDEIVAVGDSRFQAKCHEELFVKRADRARIIVSHDPGYIRSHCDRAVVLQGGKLHAFDTLDDAYSYYTEMMA